MFWIKKIKIKRFILVRYLPFVGLFIVSLLFFIFSINNNVLAQTSSDAIAIRVVPNLNHYSPFRWYNEQGFTGSPQSLIVDGYEAIRDGRTVYVNVANINNDILYTNIYLISYNQNAESSTIDIFGRILFHWKFNTNIIGSGNCSNDTEKFCLTSFDCKSDGYCNSPKASITRDTKRLADLVEINMYLEDYKDAQGNYPSLLAGTYLSNKTISTWPSWQETLGEKLGTTLPVDPINKLGACDGYDSSTCWNEEAKEFADSDISDPDLNLPSGSNVFVYNSSVDGGSYNLCSIMESDYAQNLDSGACP